MVVKALNFVCDVNPSLDNISADVKLAFFNETRHAFGRTALLLSGGAGLGFYHVGFVKALFDQVRRPWAPPGSMLEDGGRRCAGGITTAGLGYMGVEAFACR